MAQNRKIRMGMAHSSSKNRERELIKLAKRLAKDPLSVLPECTPDVVKDPFLKARKQLEIVKSAADDEELLKRLSKKGEPIARAVAGTILLKHAGKVPMLATYRTPAGEANYATRGKTSRESLVGVQNIDHPVWRLFAVIDTVKKKKVFVYSGKKKMVCTGRQPDPPKDFVDFNIKQLPFHLTRSGNVYSCKHLNGNDVEKGTVEGRAYLEIYWSSADCIIALDETCAKAENTPGLLNRYMAGPKLTADFQVKVHYRPTCGIEDCSQCKEDWDLSLLDVKKYQKGMLSDIDLIKKGRKIFEDRMTGEGRNNFLAKGVCYGSDINAFIDSLNPDEVERTALEAAFEDYGRSLITDSTSPSKILAQVWDTKGRAALNAVTGSPEITDELMRSYDPSKTSVSSLLHEAEKMIKIHAILSRLPEYGSLPKDWEFADGVARSFRTGGKNEAIDYIQKRKDASMSLAWAFLKAMDASSGKEWMFNEIQKEHGSGVTQQARNLLDVDSSGYHDALSGLMRAVGSSKEIEPLGSQ